MDASQKRQQQSLFQSIESDREFNDAIFTVADRDSARCLECMQTMVADLQIAIRSRGWKSTWLSTSAQGLQICQGQQQQPQP